MAIEESEFNKKVKNEIIYTFDDIILKTKKKEWLLIIIKMNKIN